ncbi:MAG: hypothetical protein IT475_11275 [Aquimonas sp.]|jgi:prefoldin subunit 5|nr:hypothetical protein [Xanthomonadales bacterium]MCC6506014.1 hypothetical protein [Aquimonas sp.]
MTVESDVGKLFDGLGIPSPSPIDPGRFAMTCSRYCADTLLGVGKGVYVLEEIGNSVTLTLGVADIPTAREVIRNEIDDLGDGLGTIAESLRAILGHFDRIEAGLVR